MEILTARNLRKSGQNQDSFSKFLTLTGMSRFVHLKSGQIQGSFHKCSKFGTMSRKSGRLKAMPQRLKSPPLRQKIKCPPVSSPENKSPPQGRSCPPRVKVRIVLYGPVTIVFFSCKSTQETANV